MQVREISSDELKAKMDQGEDFVLVDVLGPKSYASLHLPNAVTVNPDEDFVSQVIRLVKEDLDMLVIVYGLNFRDEKSTVRAAELSGAGFNSVLDFKGGLKDWAAELYPLEGERAPK